MEMGGVNDPLRGALVYQRHTQVRKCLRSETSQEDCGRDKLDRSGSKQKEKKVQDKLQQTFNGVNNKIIARPLTSVLTELFSKNILYSIFLLSTATPGRGI